MSSIRLRGLSSRTELDDILDQLKFNSDFIWSHGLAKGHSGLEATVTFQNETTKVKALGTLKDMFRWNNRWHEIQTDDTFHGITTLFSPECADDEISVDIVAVHGIEGHGANTWTSKNSTPRIWIRDFLPQSFPNARIMCFGYESKVRSDSIGGVKEAAQKLLSDLGSNRDTNRAKTRPLIFLAHSLGGIVVKKALTMARFLETRIYDPVHHFTSCIAFFGTPHRGSQTASWGGLVARIFSISTTRSVSVKSLNFMRRDSKPLAELASSFAIILREQNIKVLSLIEQCKTKVKFTRILVVPTESAMIGHPDEVPITVQASHREMCRFPSKHDADYMALKGRLLDAHEGWRPTLETIRKKETVLAVEEIPPESGIPDIDDTKVLVEDKAWNDDKGQGSAQSGQITFPPYIHVQYDRQFTGREALIKDIRPHLLSEAKKDTAWPPCALIHGTPGMGKTSLAMRIVRDTKQQYDYIFVLSAEFESKLLQDFKEVFRLLRLDQGQNMPMDTPLEVIRASVVDHLTKTKKRWLLVFDNADRSRILRPSWPNKGRGSIIVTTRNKYLDQNLPENIDSFQLGGLSENEGEQLLWSRVRFMSNENDDKALCKKLAKHFDCWPLVLRQLAGFMIHSHTTPQAMWDLVQNTTCRSNVDAHIYAYNGNTDYPEGTLLNAWTHILSALSPDSSGLLNLLSLLGPEQIPAELFPGKHVSKTESFRFLDHGLGYRDARADLMKYELITLTPDENTISIHRVVQSTRLKMISDSERSDAFDTALSTLRGCFPCQILGDHMHSVGNECGKYLAHVLAFSKAEREWTPKLRSYPDYINLMCDCTWYMWEIGQYNEALKLLEHIEAVCTGSIGLHSLEAARIYVNRGSILSTLNRYDEAGKLFDKGLQIRLTLLRQNDPLLANSYMQMGNYYTSKGRFDQAVQAHLQVIAIRRRSSETPVGLMTISHFNLCRSLLMGGRLDEAEAYLEKAKELEPRFDKDRELLQHKSHLLYILGNINLARGATKAALQIHREVHQTRLQISAPKYFLAASLHKIGTIYERLDDYDMAITSYKEAVSTLEAVPGTEPAKLLRLARTEIRISNIATQSQYERDHWRDKAHRHYCEAFKRDLTSVGDWSRIDFDGLVPVIDR